MHVMQLILPHLAYPFNNIRTYLLYVAQVITTVAALLLWLLLVKETGGLLFAIIILSGVGAGYGVLMGLAIANTASYTNNSVASSTMYNGYCLGNFVGPLVFKSGDAPRHPKGFIVVSSSIVALLLALLHHLRYIWSNRKRDEDRTEESFDHAHDDDLTDRTNRHFMYTL